MASRGQRLNRAYAYGAVVVGIAVFAALTFLVNLQPYLAWLVGWSMATFLLYGLDKAQAVRHGWRVPESVLHGSALIGGFIGGWLGMFIFRHKTRKPVFKVVLVVATAIGVGLFYLLVVRP